MRRQSLPSAPDSPRFDSRLSPPFQFQLDLDFKLKLKTGLQLQFLFLLGAVMHLIVTFPVGAQVAEEDLSALRLREIGPAVTGGRVHDVEALPADPSTIWLGAASGGVWKSTDAGTTWEPLWNDLPNSSVGDIALAPSDPEIVYVGTGGPNNRQSTLYGNGVWRSDDGGATWRHLGLVETRHIGRIRIHPDDPDVAWVAALGNLWRADDERGIFKTTNGGRSWRKVLFVDEDTGAVDLVLDPFDPDVLYAATYQRRRRTWGFAGGGPGSGIWKTTDGGRNWTELTTGLPAGDKGRIGLAIAATEPGVVVATVEHRGEGGVYRTGDGGARWEKVNDLNPRPMYYSHIYLDPTNADRIYVLGTSSSVSEDGGRTFRRLPTSPTYDIGVHADHHALWIDPGDPEHLMLAGDAGLYVSWDGGRDWLRVNNLAIGQFYGIGVDMQDPYHIYGGMQDNHSWMGPSRTRRFIGLVNDDWRQIGFGDGMYTRPDPIDPRRVYLDSNGGGIERFDTFTGSSQGIKPDPPEGERYRFDWTAPILISPHEHRTVYLGGNRLFISRDGGTSWERTIDLSKNLDRNELPIMGRPTGRETLSRNDGVSSYGEITTIAESPLVPGLLWVGTDDGNVQVSRDGGRSWRNVAGRFANVPERTYVSRVAASAHEPDRAYVTFDAHRDGDFRPFVFATEDGGESWRALTLGLPEEGSVNIIVEHPRTADLLFVGTEHGLFVSLDRGRNWRRMGGGLPSAPVDDLVIHPRENDLIVGTHGRSLWVLDDITPLQELAAGPAADRVCLFDLRPVCQWQLWKATSYRGQGAYSAEQPPDGAVITYRLADRADTVTVEIRDPGGRLIRTLGGPGTPGMHRLVWDLRLAPPPREDIQRLDRGDRSQARVSAWLQGRLDPRGPFVLPDTYIVRLRAGTVVREKTLEVRPDPLDPLTGSERRERWAFLLDTQTVNREAFDRGLELRALRDEVRRVRSAVRTAAEAPAALGADLDTLDRDLGTLYRRFWNEVRRGTERLLNAFAGSGVETGTLLGPTADQRTQVRRLRGDLDDAERERLLLNEETIPALNRRLRAAGLAEISRGEERSSP